MRLCSRLCATSLHQTTNGVHTAPVLPCLPRNAFAELAASPSPCTCTHARLCLHAAAPAVQPVHLRRDCTPWQNGAHCCTIPSCGAASGETRIIVCCVVKVRVLSCFDCCVWRAFWRRDIFRVYCLWALLLPSKLFLISSPQECMAATSWACRLEMCYEQLRPIPYPPRFHNCYKHSHGSRGCRQVCLCVAGGGEGGGGVGGCARVLHSFLRIISRCLIGQCVCVCLCVCTCVRG